MKIRIRTMCLLNYLETHLVNPHNRLKIEILHNHITNFIVNYVKITKITILYFINPTEDNQVENEPELYGNFLHITDFHPDPHYVNNITARSRCHQQNVGQANRPEFMLVGVSGPWGAPATICDSPPNLIDATFEW